MDLSDVRAELFQLPPEEFTAERNRIAGELKRSGDTEGAAEVKALKRPSLGAYALNLVARRHPDLVAALLESTQRLGTATSRAAMDDAKAERQKAIGAISGEAASLLAGQGRPITAQVKEKLTETLLAVATDEETREALRLGVLQKEAVTGGLGGPVTPFAASHALGAKGEAMRDRASKLRAEAEAKLAEAGKARAESERAMREFRELAEASAAAKERALRLGNIAASAEEAGKARLAQAEELERAL